jgi:hypothetical protein
MTITDRVRPVSDASIAIGGAVPLVVEWERSLFDPPLYWRTGDFRLSLAEAGFARGTGALCWFSLVLVREIVLLDEDPVVGPVQVPEGLPACDPETWTGRTRTGSIRTTRDAIVDEPDVLVAELGPTSFRVRFAETGWSRVLVSGRVRCWITAAGELGGLEITGVTAAERGSLLEYAARLAADRAKGVQRGPRG